VTYFFGQPCRPNTTNVIIKQHTQ